GSAASESLQAVRPTTKNDTNKLFIVSYTLLSGINFGFEAGEGHWFQPIHSDLANTVLQP
ncbi:hypothetical protein Q4595_26595, partial [Wenyingzhuangia sp. 1_MG-2023]|nr:hypothetical protein [Wenyingzhuangia sp. 1_MG-2023]